MSTATPENDVLAMRLPFISTSVRLAPKPRSEADA